MRAYKIEKERRRGSEKKNSPEEEKKSKRKKERKREREKWTKKKPSSHRANEPIFSHLARPDGRSGEERKENGGEVAMNFALPEDEVNLKTEERGGARERSAMHSGKK